MLEIILVQGPLKIKITQFLMDSVFKINSKYYFEFQNCGTRCL